MRAAPLRRALERALGDRSLLLRSVVELAKARGARCYLVGGPVRDLLLEHPIGDLDLLLSHALAPFARELARRLSGRAALHPEFQTATVETPEVRIDLAQARREHYPRPGALPEVEPAEVGEDLLRRDFSIHALALPLLPLQGDVLLDPGRGLADLKARRLRVLHDRSFRDDPTRLLRLARYSARLDFGIEPRTRRLAREAIQGGALDTVSGDRIRHELERALLEPQPQRAIALTRRLAIFPALEASWRGGTPRPLARLGRCAQEPPWHAAGDAETRVAAGMRLLLLGLRSRQRVRLLARLSLRGGPADQLETDLRWLVRERRALERTLSPGGLDARLAGASEAALLALYCAGTATVGRKVGRYVVELRPRPDPIDGHRARALGLRGREIGALLAAARSRALDGAAVDESWLSRWCARHRAAPKGEDC